jgi:hypothetical protein
MVTSTDTVNLQPGRCFWFVGLVTSGTPVHCQTRVAYRGLFKDQLGRHHPVEACPDHVHDLIDWQQIG